MQEQGKEQALALQHSQNLQLADRMAGSGRFGSGYQGAQERRTADSTMQAILGGNRDINLNAATANWNSRLGALQNASSVMGASVDRAGTQAGENYKGFNSQADATKYALGQALSQEQVNQSANAQNMQRYALALQSALGTTGMDQNYLQILADLAKFNATQNNKPPL